MLPFGHRLDIGSGGAEKDIGLAEKATTDPFGGRNGFLLLGVIISIFIARHIKTGG